MIEIVQSVVALIVTLSVLVTIHEYGHYIVARWCGVHVLRFSVGFGRPLWMKRGRAPLLPPPPPDQIIATRSNVALEGTEFAVAGIPLGGYVKMLDEREGFVPDDQLHLAFNRKPVWQRMAIAVAGPVANFLLAIVAYWLLYSVGVTGLTPRLGEIDDGSKAGQAGLSRGQEVVAVDGVPTRTWSDVNMQLFQRIGDTGRIVFDVHEGESQSTQVDQYVVDVENWLADANEPYPTRDLGMIQWSPPLPAKLGSIVADESAERAGFLAGDHVRSANGEAVDDWYDWVEVVKASPSRRIDVEVERSGQFIALSVVPRPRTVNGEVEGFFGASVELVALPPDMYREVRYPIYLAWIPALERTWSVTAFTLNAIGKMIMGAISPKNLSGPITIAQVASASAESGFETFIGFLALLSISLAVINLMPIPMLDGGHLVYYTFEAVFGRPVPDRVQEWGLQVGLFLIVSIMVLAFYNDLTRL